MGEQVIYVYGIVEPAADIVNAPPGLDGARVSIEREGDTAALVSALDAAVYGRDAVEAQSADVEWVAPRAVAHDAVLTWASDAGPVVPLPMFTLFTDGAAVRAMLRERADELRATLDRVAPAQELGVRVFRVDAELARHMAELSPAIAELEGEAQSATPGQRYLLERKAERARAAELRRVAADVAHDVYDALAGHAIEGTTEPLPTRDGGQQGGGAVLNAYFLVRRDALDPFRAALTTLVRRYEPLGFRFDFTGPWPPYHFAGGRA